MVNLSLASGKKNTLAPMHQATITSPQSNCPGSSPSLPMPFLLVSFLSRVFLVCSSSPCRGTDGCAGFFLLCEDTIKLLILVSKGVDVFDNGKI